jgi:FkbM family methyltransferase
MTAPTAAPRRITHHTVRGTTFPFDDPSSSVARDAVPGQPYEPLVAALLDEALRAEGSSFADVGALYGFFSCWAARHRPGTRIVAFEPEPAYVEVMERNRRLGGSAFEIAQVALSDRIGTLDFHGRTVEPDDGFTPWRRDYVGALRGSLTRRITDRSSSADHILLSSEGDEPRHSAWTILRETLRDRRRPPGPVDETHQVPATTLDAWAEEHGFWPSVIKMDVHGGEGPALRGMPEALTRADHLLLELHTPDNLVDSSLDEIIDGVVASGMAVYELRGFRRTRGRLIPLTADRRRDLADTSTWSVEDLYYMKALYATRSPLP